MLICLFGFHECSASHWPAGVSRGGEGAVRISHDAGGGFLSGSQQQQHRWESGGEQPRWSLYGKSPN